MNPFQLAMMLAGTGMNIYGQFRQQHQQDWENGLRMEEFNRRNAANERVRREPSC